jgi:hypothetical protein
MTQFTQRQKNNMAELIHLLALEYPDGLTAEDIMAKTGWSLSKLNRTWSLLEQAVWPDPDHSPGFPVVVYRDGKVIRRLTKDADELMKNARRHYRAYQTTMEGFNVLAKRLGLPTVEVATWESLVFDTDSDDDSGE